MQHTHITRTFRRAGMILFMLILAVASMQQLSAQCNNLSAYGSATAPAAGITTTITTCQYATEYATITSAVAGNSYTSTSSITTDWITVRQGTPGGTVAAFGPTPLTWTASVAGTYYVHYNTNSACGTSATCRTSTIIGRGTGCTNFTAYTSAAAPTTATLTTVSSCIYASEYHTVTGALAGAAYQVTSSVTTDWLTVRQGSYNGPVVAKGPTPLNFYTAVGGNYYIHVNTNTSCGTAASCRNLQMSRLYAPAVPVGCTNLSLYPSAFTAPAAGTTYTISTCQFQSEYNQMNSVVAGNTFISTGSIAGTYITVRYGTYNGAVVASGTTPLSWTATAGAGSYFIHYNTNAACGTATTCMTSTIQNTTAVAFDPCTSIGAITACGTSNTTTIASGTGVWALGAYAPPGKEKLYTFTPAATGNYTITQSTNTGGSWVDYFYKPVSGGCNNTGWTFLQDLYMAPVTSTATMSLTAGVQYYIMLDPEYTTGTTVTFTVNCLGCTGTPSAGTTIASPTTFCGAGGVSNLSLSGASTGAGITYQWQSSPTGVTYSNIAGATLSTYAPFVASTTYYRCLVTCTTTGLSATSLPASITVSAAPLGDVLANPIVIGSLPYSTTGNNQTINCWTNNIGQTSPDVYYRVIPTCNGTMNMSMCGGGTMSDTYIHILNAAGTILASNDDFGPSCGSALASLNYTVTAGTTYYVVCEGYSTNEGTYSLSVSLTPTYITYYADADGDTYGNAGSTTSSCSGTPVGYVTNSTDCNDGNSSVYPGATEVCNGIDDDCDAVTDDGLTFTNYYADADGDGYGDADVSPVSSCSPVAGSVTNNSDCDDSNISIYPGATEVCNGIDDDCDGAADDGIAFTTYYADADGDGFGDPATSSATCDGAPAGYIMDNSDCDDTQFLYSDIDGDGFGSGSPVACGVANNSDCYPIDMTYVDGDGDGFGGDVLAPCGVINSDDCNDAAALYVDIDGDGFGSGSPAACGVANNSDCFPLDVTYADGDGDGFGSDDLAPCGVINSDDCDDAATLYVDIDGDGFGSGSPAACGVANNSDCYPLDITYGDGDGDGFGAGAMTPCGVITSSDCNDAMSSVYPGAPELCNAVDDDCDGLADDGLTFLDYYVDVDGDGYGDATATAVNSCSLVAGSVTNNGDCDDSNIAINPAAAEVCDGMDNDCDGAVDDGLVFENYYTDADSDTYGDATATPVNSCSPVAGSVTNNGDCDDDNASINPAATEVCNAVDEDCDGLADDGLTFLDYYVDGDGDGYGDATATAVNSCSPVAGSVTNNGDCDDSNIAINPAAAEVCDGMDNDCDGAVDDGLVFENYYTDADSDTYGDAAATPVNSCSPVAGSVTNNGDCDDDNASINPAATEVCNAVDEDCDGLADDGLTFLDYYVDGDGDGYGDATATAVNSCSPVAGSVTNDGDCDDSNIAINPAATEACNAIDDDCDGSTDDGLTFNTYYVDADSDGFGDAATSTTTCDGPPAGYITDNTDCDDTQFLYSDIDGDGFGSGSPVACGVANNSDCYPIDITYADGDGDGFGSDDLAPCGVINSDDCDDAQLLYADIDGDSFGSGSPVACGVANNSDCFPLDITYLDGDGDGFGAGAPVACGVITNTDCDNANENIYPGAPELCNAIDDDCDGLADDGLTFLDYYTDADGDGYGDATATAVNSCSPVAGSVTNDDDCDDDNVSINPAASEICNAIDDDCSGTADDGLTFITYYADADGDGFGDAAVNTTTCDGAPTGYVADMTDCDDTNAAISPADAEVCNAIDDDCDGAADDGLTFLDYYTDGDGDGYGDATATAVNSCSAIAGSVNNNDDCDDDNASINPAASEICNAIDDDCNGTADDGLTFLTYYADADGDGFGDAAVNTTTCDGAPTGYVADMTDCDDTNAAISPADAEVCNAIDDDCDGATDEDLVFTTYYADADGDGFGNIGATTSTCDGMPTGYVADATDCDDAYSTVYPGAAEICDGLDNDCDGDADEGTVTATITPAGTVTICKDEPETLFANTGVGYTYQWFKNGNLIPGATASTYAPNKPAYYQVQVNTPEGCFAVSPVTSVQTNPMPNANIFAPNGTSLCTSVKLKASWDATYTWQWLLEGAAIPGETSYLYFPTTPGNYSCTITNAYGCDRTTAILTVTACREDEAITTAVPESFELYPNPAESEFMVEMELNTDATEAQVYMLNVVGAEVYAGTVSVEHGTVNQSISLDDTIPSGMYIVKVLVANKEYTKQLVIQK